MRNSSLLAFTAALLPVVASFAASPEPPAGDTTAGMARAAALLATRTDADSQAAAGLANLFTRRDEALRLVAQASIKAPERADLAWLNIQLCLMDTTCDPQPLERRLRDLDGKNGAGWMDELARASKRGDEDAKSAALAAIGRSERMDTYWTTLIVRLSRQIAGTEAVSLLYAESFVQGALAGVAIPAYQAISSACKGERLLRDEVVKVCRDVATALMNGDTAITELIGIAIALRAWPENSPKWLEAAQARRVWEYRFKSAGSVDADAWSRTHASDHLALYEQHRREQDVLKAVLIASGRNPDPPPIKSEPAPVRSP